MLDYGAANADDRGNGLTITLLPESVRVVGFGTVSITNYTISELIISATALADTVLSHVFVVIVVFCLFVLLFFALFSPSLLFLFIATVDTVVRCPLFVLFFKKKIAVFCLWCCQLSSDHAQEQPGQ